MKIFALSDTHFGHTKMYEIFGRPVDYESRILRSLSKNKGDLLIHCGDFCIGKDHIHIKDFMHAAAGFDKKILVRGNHDKKSDAWYIENGFDVVCEIFWARHFGRQIIYSHMPVLEPSKMTFAPHFDPDINIHGHLHGDNDRHNLKRDIYDPSWFYDLAPETNEYGIVNVENIVADINELKFQKERSEA